MSELKKMAAGVTGSPMSKDPWENYEKLRKIGYRTFQGAAGQLESMEDPAEAYARYKEMGMFIHSVGIAPKRDAEPFSFPSGGFAGGRPVLPEGHIVEGYLDMSFGYRCTDEQIEDTIALCEKYGTNIVVNYNSPCINDMMGTKVCEPDVFYMALEEMEQIAEKFKKAGISYCYHNHDREFKLNFNSLAPIEQLLARTSALALELDVGWVQAGGYDPTAFFKKVADRVAAVHVKDIREGQRPNVFGALRPDFCAVGTGLVNFDTLLPLIQEKGIKTVIVEQDSMRNLTVEESLTAAYLNLKETGFVE